NPCGGATVTPTNTPNLTPTRTNTLVLPTLTSTIVVPPSNTATMLPTSTPCTIQFGDVPEGSTFYPYIRCLSCHGIISGYSDGTFRPNNNVTRGQLSKIVSNSADFNDPIPPTQQSYTDVTPSQTFWLWIERLTLH